MRKGFWVAILLFSTAAWGEGLEGKCDIAFHGTSTFVSFDGTASCEPFILDINPQRAQAKLAAPGEIIVPVDGMTTGLGMRDKDMREMLDSASYPQIRGSIAPFDPRAKASSLARAEVDKLVFDLTIRGETRPVVAEVTRFEESAEAVDLDFAFEVSLKDFDIKPPRVFLFVKVGDKVTVKVRMTLLKGGVDFWFRGAVSPVKAPGEEGVGAPSAVN